MDNVTTTATSSTPHPAELLSSNNTGTLGGSKKSKKVRSACERCRYRRIKCDGQTPACSNCAKSGSVCIDVDSRNADRKVSRSFVEDAVARIAWLEGIIRTQLPHVHIDDGLRSLGGAAEQGDSPSWNNVDTHHLSRSSPQQAPGPILQTDNFVSGIENSSTLDANSYHSNLNHGLKRSLPGVHNTPERASSMEQDTLSVALNLGLLSLNSDSRQLHYLGSSSGSLLVSLVQTERAHNGEGGNLIARTSSPEIDDISRNATDNSTTHRQVQFDAMRTSINDLYTKLRKDLPPRKDCDTLCNQFFSQLHPNHPFLHRASFSRMVDALYVCAATKPPVLIQHNGWPESVEAFDCNGEEHISNGRRLIPVPIHVAAFQVLLVLSIGAILRVRRRLYHHDPETFFNSAMTLTNHVFKSISLPSLQATLLLLVHSLVGPSINDIWTLTHLAMAHSIDLGLHHEVGSNSKFSRIAVEMRRRIFFCVYTFDRSISTIQGRPFSISDGFFDVNLPSLIPNQSDSANGRSSVHSDNECMGYSIHLFKMSRLISRIKTYFYRLSTSSDDIPWPVDIAVMQLQLSDELNQWVSEVPSVVRSAPAELKLRLSMKLKIHYHGTMCLLHQPSQAIVQPSDHALQLCYQHAAERLRLFETLYESGNLVHSWRTVHDMFLAGTTVMYCVWISPAVRESVSLPELASICRTCSSLLSVGGEWWPMIRKSRLSLERLATHTIEMFAERSKPSTNTSGMSTETVLSDDLAQSNTLVETLPGWLPEHIEEALTSVLNHDHDGHLSHIFETPANPSFPIAMLDQNDGLSNFDDAFWASFGNYIPNDGSG